MLKNLLIVSFLFIFSSVKAQGPGGIDTTNLTLWLKADTGVVYDNDSNVLHWEDLSNYGNHLDSVFGNGKPNFRESSTNYNDRNVVIFNADSMDILKSDAFSSTYDFSGDGFTLFMLFYFQKGASSTGAGWFSTADALSAPKTQLNLNGNNFQIRGNASGKKTSLGTSVFAAPRVYTITRDVAGATVRTKQNGTERVSKSFTATAAYEADLFKLGENYDGTKFSEMDVAEVIFYNRVATTMEIKIIENYFSAKYNIDLLSTDRYAGDETTEGDYDYGIAGLGNDGSTTETTANSSGLLATVSSGFSTDDYFYMGHTDVENTRNITDTAGIGGNSPARWERVWYFDGTNTTAGNNIIDLVFDMSKGGGSQDLTAADPNDYVLIFRSAQTGSWTVVDTAVSITNTDQVNFNDFDITDNGDGYYTLATRDYTGSPLPVELATFTAKLVNGGVNLKWATASESNNDYFILQRSNSGSKWNRRATVEGAGNSTNVNRYSFKDVDPLKGVSYYRLKQVDYDGNYKYSKVIKVNNKLSSKYTIMPNPTTGKFSIIGKIHRLDDIKMYNSVGKEVDFRYNEVKNGITINTNQLRSGVYTIMIPTVNGYKPQKVLVNKK